jgi:hypothetical protein
MKTEATNRQDDQVKNKTKVKDAYKKPGLTKHDSLRDITGQVASGGVINPGGPGTS